jgi:hypothetical protein
MTPVQRAVFAAEIIDGKIVVQGLTTKAVASLCGASPAYVFAALKLTPEARSAVSTGMRPLIPTRPRPAPSYWTDADTDDILEMVRAIGVDQTLNAAIKVEAEATSS